MLTMASMVKFGGKVGRSSSEKKINPFGYKTLLIKVFPSPVSQKGLMENVK
jgi:hypothetical protein